MLLKWDSISWQRTLVILGNFVQWCVANTLFLEMMNHHNQEDGFKETRGLDLLSESGLWVKTILSLGSVYLMEQTKYVIDSNHNKTEIPADAHEDQKSQTSVKVIASRSKAKAKPQKRQTDELPRHYSNVRATWLRGRYRLGHRPVVLFCY